MNTTPQQSSGSSASPSDTITATYEILEHIREAWRAGRPIVPIIGAGFSADSGFPILNSICRYLARLKLALAQHELLPDPRELPPYFGTRCRDLRDTALGLDGTGNETRRPNPVAYVQAFGWPNRFELTQLLARRFAAGFTSRDGGAHEEIEKHISLTFDWLGKHSTTQRAATEWDKFLESKVKEDVTPADRAWRRWAVQGDWRRLIQFFTSHQSDVADELFAQFSASRAPSRGHRALSQLIQLMSLRRVFTFNFDDLIEKTLAADGVAHRLFGMEHGRTLPSPGSVGEGLAVVKMHGSHHSILIDERLDRPLTAEYIERFYKLAGPNAVLLVLGCSGDDRRLADLLKARRKRDRLATVCWLHFENECPLGPDVRDRKGDKVLSAAVNSPGAFVRHLLYYLSGRFPEAATSYSSHPYLPALFGKCDLWVNNPLRYDGARSQSYYSCLNVNSSEELLRWGHLATNSSFVPIWIDLEAVHTLAGLVGSIVDGCRRVDADFAPAVMPVDDSASDGNQKQREHALSLLEHALQRQRYAVLIDGLGTYTSNLLMHHGQSEPKVGTEGAPGTDALRTFLDHLLARNLGQSIVLASKYDPKPRRAGGNKPEGAFPLPGDVTDGPALAWIALATLRRTRALPTLRHLLTPLLPPRTTCASEDCTDTFLRERATKYPRHLLFLEGGETWFVRDKRDAYYDTVTWYSSKDQFEQIGSSTTCQQVALAQCALAGLMHRKVASTYFTFEFMQSRDAQSFMEYTYHRFSNLRYFSRVIYLLQNYPEALSDARAHFKGLCDKSQGRDGLPPADYFGELGDQLFGTASAPALIEELRKARLCDLQALLAAWQEWEQTVRSQIPAEQLLLWLEQLTDEKMSKRLVGVYCGEGYQEDESDGAKNPLGAVLQAERQKLLAYFKRLTVRVLVERGDLHKASKRLDPNATDAQALFDRAELLVRSADSNARDRLGEARATSRGEAEAELRYHHLSGLLHLGGTSFIEAGIAPTGSLRFPEAIGARAEDRSAAETPEAVRERIRKSREDADSGIYAIRGAGAQLAPALDGMIVGAGSSGGAYRPYRAVFRTLKGRCLAAQLLVNAFSDSALDDDLAALRGVMREFDQAKGGLESQHALLRGWADLHAAETTVLFVRRTFARSVLDNTDEHLGLIGAKLAVCGSQLGRAFEGLRSGRRNAIWWRHYHQVAAQYATERLLLNLCKLQQTGRPGKAWAPEEGDLRRQYRNALESVAAFIDCSFERDKAFQSEWLRRVLSEALRGTALALVAHEWRAGKCQNLLLFENFRRTLEELYGRAVKGHPRAFGKRTPPTAELPPDAKRTNSCLRRFSRPRVGRAYKPNTPSCSRQSRKDRPRAESSIRRYRCPRP